VTRILDFCLTSSWRSPSVKAVPACFVAQYMPSGWIGGKWPTTLEAENGNVALSTAVHNHKTAYCTLPRMNTVNKSSNITNTEQRLIYTDNIYSNLLHTSYHSQVTSTCFGSHVAI
jgi:hypothetical protein